MLLSSPTERVYEDARVSSLPERHGCDFLSTSPVGFIGYQRKTLPDLAASIHDGRLAKELGQMSTSPLLVHAFLILEYDPTQVTVDGEPLGRAVLPMATIRSLIAKAHALGIGYLNTRDPTDTLAAIRATTAYLARGTATRLHRPKPERNSWGQRDSRAWALHLLQSFPGIGPQTAAAIYDALGLPFAWTCTVEDLRSIPGIGVVTAERLLKALGGSPPAPPRATPRAG